ncbi:MAG TPA: type II toxin-antitoxin system VapC family toxin [Solirubrobacterales bacterium]|nr:type II toxin-antitoxin system VapC family toxin [Solirubrobacterales bacterium]
MILADVNVLVYAHREDLPQHGRCSAWLREEVESGRSFAVCDVSCTGFLRVVTNARVFADPTPLDVALRFVEALRGHAGAIALSPGTRHWALFSELCGSIGARGNDIPDAYLAALAIESGSELVTADKSFGRFPGLRWSCPV